MTDYGNKRVVILGLARQGVALARYLAEQGAQVVVSDMQPATSPKLAAGLAALSNLKIEYVLGEHPVSLLDGADGLCLSGGVSADLPLAQEALRRHIPLSNDTQVFLEACPSGVKTVGITGSAGKTTTTTLVGQMLALTPRGEQRVWVGGNIGNPLIADLHQMQPGDVAVMELSVGAGLVTVLMVYALSVVGEDALDPASVIPKPLALGLVGAVTILLGWMVYPAIQMAITTGDVDLASVLWQSRVMDVWIQIVLIFSGVLGVLGLLSEREQGQNKETSL